MKFLPSRTISTDTAVISIIIAIFICIRVVSFGYLSILSDANTASLYQYPIVSGDSIHYATLGNNFLTFNAYQWSAGIPYRGAPPGYSAFLAAVKAVTGSMTPAIVIQVLCAACATYFLYRMTRTLIPTSFAWIPALGYALDPMTIFCDSTIVTDGICSALLLLIVYVTFFQTRIKGMVRWALVGLFLGLTVLIRPIAMYLILVFPVLYVIEQWMNGVHLNRAHLKSMIVFFITCVVAVTPWVIRNEIYFGSPEVSNLGADDLLKQDAHGFLAWRALAQTTHPLPALLIMRHTNDPIFATIDTQISADLARMTPVGGDPNNYEGRLALHYIFSDPIRYAYFHAINMVPFFITSSVATYGQISAQVGSNSEFYAPTSALLINSLSEIRHPKNLNAFLVSLWSIAPIGMELVWWVAVSLTALYGAIRYCNRFTIILCAVMVLYFAGLTGPMSTSRYRIPAEPYLLILASVGAYALTHRKNAQLTASERNAHMSS